MRAILFGYTCLLLGMIIYSYAFVDHNFFYLKSFYSNITFGHRLLVTVVYIFFIILFFFFYFLFLKLYAQNKLTSHSIKILIGITIAVLFVSYPAMLSSDVFNYVATAKVTYFYGENPYIIMPIEFTGDSLLKFTHAANKIALYGPFWILITYFPHMMGFGNYLVTMFLFKIIIAAFFVATLWLIFKISKNWYSALLFAFNPLIVIETLLSAHNDIVMMFFALLAFYFLHSKKVLSGIAFLMLSVLIKYATVFLIPVFVYIYWLQIKRRRVTWEKISFLSMIAMLFIFFLSPLREEMYPWYFIWPFIFSVFINNKKLLLYSMTALSFGLILRYAPFILLRTHFEQTPLIKLVVTFVPLAIVLLYYFIRQKKWQKIFSY